MHKVKTTALAMSPTTRRKANPHFTVDSNGKRVDLDRPDNRMHETSHSISIPGKHTNDIDHKIYNLKEKMFQRLALPSTPPERLTLPEWAAASSAAQNLNIEKQQWFTEPVPFAVPVNHTWTEEDITFMLENIRATASETGDTIGTPFMSFYIHEIYICVSYLVQCCPYIALVVPLFSITDIHFL